MFSILLLTLTHLLPLIHSLPSPPSQQQTLRLQDHPSPRDAYISSSGSSSTSRLPSGWVRSHCPDAIATLCANFRNSSPSPSLARGQWIHAGTVCQVGVYIPSKIETESSEVAFQQQGDNPDRVKRDQGGDTSSSDANAKVDADADGGRQHVISWWEPATEWTGTGEVGNRDRDNSKHESQPRQERGSDSVLDDEHQIDTEGQKPPFPSEEACLHSILHPLATLLDSATTKDHALDRASVNVAVPGGFPGGEDGWGIGTGSGTGMGQKEGEKGKEAGVPMQRGLVRWVVMGQTEGHEGVKSEMRRWVDG